MKRGKYTRTEAIKARNRLSSLKSSKRGEENRNWQGGKYIESDKGYVMVRDPKHIRARKNGYVLEHILVMEKMLGRGVDHKTEIIHHKNKIRSDNRPENLQLLSHKAHSQHHNQKYFNCSINDCARNHFALGYCAMHYKRKHRAVSGIWDKSPKVLRDKSRICAIDDCEKTYFARGVCGYHYSRRFRRKRLNPI